MIFNLLNFPEILSFIKILDRQLLACLLFHSILPRYFQVAFVFFQLIIIFHKSKETMKKAEGY